MQPDQPTDPRTALAHDRTVLAAERTFASWLRTGLAFLASGLAAERVLGDVLRSSHVDVLATTLVVCALACFLAAAWRDSSSRRRLRAAEIRMLPRTLTIGLWLTLVLISLGAAILIWIR